MNTTRPQPLLPPFPLAQRWIVAAGLLLSLGASLPGQAATPPAVASPPAAAASQAASQPANPPVTAKEAGEQVREAVGTGVQGNKRLTLVVNGKEKKFISIPATEAPPTAEAPAEAPQAKAIARVAAPAQASRRAARVLGRPLPSHAVIRAKPAMLTEYEMAPKTPSAMAAAHAESHEVHWSYEGANGPQAWGSLKPDFNLCAQGKRQSPINIEESATLHGPAEPLQFNYSASSGSVVNNGHTIQVDVYGDNVMTVRGSTYKLLQFHFHTPSEEQINYRSYAMVAHLVHKNNEGQLAVVAVLLEAGVANALIDKVWTYMPLDAGDRVQMPLGLLNMNELLPKDQRYYQFMGSLTTPPCTEGVLWMVLKEPSPISREQIKLFTQLYPRNARPVQAVNGRPVRNAR